MSETFVILIDGQSGAGKSTFADALISHPKIRPATLLRLDWIYPGWDGLAAAAAALPQILLSFRRRKIVQFETWDWSLNAAGPRRCLPAESVLVVEGAGCLTTQTRALCDLAIWLEAPQKQRQARALARDGEVYAPHWQRWQLQERQHLALNQPQNLADLIFCTSAD